MPQPSPRAVVAPDRGRASQARLLHTYAEGQHPEGGHGQHQPGPVHCRPMRLRDRKPCSIPTPVPWASSSASSGDSSVSRIQGVSWPGIRSTIRVQCRLRRRKARPARGVPSPPGRSCGVRSACRDASPVTGWRATGGVLQASVAEDAHRQGGQHGGVQPIRQDQGPGQTPQADAVHIQSGHPLSEGRRPLVGGHAGRQGRGAGEAGLVLPALDAEPAEEDQVTGTGTAAVLGGQGIG